jgi:hypothetical protein
MENKNIEQIKKDLIEIVTQDKNKDLFSLIVSVMKVVEQIKGLKGIEKKELVLYSITTVLGSDSGMTDLISSIIDNVISIDKGEIVINKKLKKFCCF